MRLFLGRRGGWRTFTCSVLGAEPLANDAPNNLFVDSPSQSVRLRLQPPVELSAAPEKATIQPDRHPQ